MSKFPKETPDTSEVNSSQPDDLAMGELHRDVKALHGIKELRLELEQQAASLGFQQVGVTGIDLKDAGAHLQTWLNHGYQGGMDYMASHDDMRWTPEKLFPGALRVISVRMDYRPADVDLIEALNSPSRAYISRYALGRDYHKLIRKRLTTLGKHLKTRAGEMGFRAFVDSAPILERAAANQAGLGWIGKNTMLINRKAGSWFFLGEILTDLPLPLDEVYEQDHCGRCTACLDICPTQAFVGPYVLDARRCISYLTIELDGPIPEPLRKGIGNRIFGCDDCQLGCPWNRFSKTTNEDDFQPRHQLDKATLIELFRWDEATFLARTEGMAIRRTGYENWLRNLAVALGNGSYSLEVIELLKTRRAQVSDLVKEHIDWAIQQLEVTN